MLNIGNHISAAGGFLAMGKEAVSLDANVFAFFTRNPRGGRAKKIDEEDITKFNAFCRENNIIKLVAHAPYTLNACSGRENIRQFAKETMADDLKRMEYVPDNYYNFHPGSHVGQGVQIGIRQIAECLNVILLPEQRTTVLLETMAGKGTEIGRSFEEIRAIIDKVLLQDKIGVCLDTCHVFDGGYDIVNDLDGVVQQFDNIIGLHRLKAIHLNDSKNSMGSHKDRHEKIGAGNIGLKALTGVINHPKLRHLPFILETPNDHDGYAGEIAMLREKYIE
ncbi:deoxyribonuclease IV [Pectinatus frisingensis]|uniref:deoxyribonuclease IV n=2 Tax=Pectinatus frisingensis TaxID=865 RepID=UPI0015F3A3BD|nr:deoxyribonuclease IV [Pectinatus frisingensis]